MTRLLAAAAILIATQAQAQPLCAPHAVILKVIEGMDQQRRLLATNPSEAMEMFVNEETGEWVIITTNSRGMTCIRMSGDAVVFEPAVAPGEPT